MFGIIHPEKIGTSERIVDGVAMIHSFANVGLVYGRGGVLVVDVSARMMVGQALRELRELTSEPIQHIVYTHGHVDHTGGTRALIEDAEQRGHPRPKIWAHERVARRFERYAKTWAWNNEVNRRQFGMPRGAEVFPTELLAPDEVYRDTVDFELAGERVELHHAEAETDDATWVWLPERRTALVGDLVIHSIPNTGNPNKPQRYTLGWAEALEAIAAKQPLHVIPGHGSPISGERALEILVETARALRYLHDAVVERLNRGMWPDAIVDAQITLPSELASKPYLQPLYGAPEFIIRDVLRAYAGWWGGDPAELMPVPKRTVAQDLWALMERSEVISRARELAIAEPRRALHLAMLLERADPNDAEARALVIEILDVLAEGETSFIARNFYRAAALERQE